MLSLVAPNSTAEVAVFYLFWVLLYLAINIIWDIRSSKTPDFHFAHLSKKTAVAFNAGSSASSMLLIAGLFNPPTMKVAGDTMVPIMLAGLSGVLFGLSELCPHKP